MLGICAPFWSVTGSLRRLSPLACAAGHATIFVVNAALMVSCGSTCVNRFLAPTH